MRATSGIRQRRRPSVSWLAVLALLINALLPASLTATTAGKSREAGSGWCGSGPADHQPVKDAAPAACDHCILCSTATGFPPPVAASIGLPALLAMASPGDIAVADPPRLSIFGLAQPRGPPVGSRI
jgi:hypothetical protein